MPYTSAKPTKAPSSDELRRSIPGWGADLNRADRPMVPKETAPDSAATGAHWEFPDRQPELTPRERSIEHRMLTPVFGTSVPTRGVSGMVRRYAYRRYSEGRAAHWLLLIGADRIDAIGSHLRSLATLRPDNPITETGILSEFRRHGISSRFGKGRVDMKHAWLDPIIIAGPWLLGGLILVRLLRGKRRR